MEGFKAIRDNRRYPLGAVQTEEGVHFSVVWAGRELPPAFVWKGSEKT